MSEQQHRTWADEGQAADGAGAWRAVCSCGWLGRMKRFDAFTDEPDPADAAHDAAQRQADQHRAVMGPDLSHLTSALAFSKAAFDAADRSYTATVAAAFDLRDALSAADTAARKLAAGRAGTGVHTVAASLVRLVEEALVENKAEQVRLGELSRAAYAAFRADEQAHEQAQNV